VPPHIKRDDILYTALFIYILTTVFVSSMTVDIYTETCSFN